MAYYYRRKRTNKRTARRKRASTKKAKSNNKVATRGYVKRIMHKEVENKYYTTYAFGQAVKIQVNSAPVVGEGLFSLIPGISLGNNSGNRIGNKVRVIKSKLNMTLTLAPYVAVTNPYVPGVYVKIFIFRFKPANDRSPTLGEWQSFFKGIGSNFSLQGNLLDINAQVETDIFDIVKTKTIFLTSSSNSANGVPNATSYMFATGKNSVNCSFDVTKHLGTMTYNDTTTTSILGKNLWCFIQPIYTQYNPASGNAFQPITLSYSHNTFYEDA